MTYRPIGARIIAYVVAGCLLVMFVAIVAALPSEVRNAVTPAQLVILLLTVGGLLAVLHGIGRTRLRTDDTGLHILNGYRHHDLEWAEVISVELNRGSAWASVDTSDGRTVQLMAIQSADGSRARANIRKVRAEVAAHS